LGNCIKKDLDFRNIVLNHFGLKKLVDLLSLIKDSRISVANGKEIMMRIIDGDQRMPTEIADSLNFTGEVITSAEVKAAVDDILAKNQQIVQKIQKTGNMGPVMSLVGKVMDAVNRKGDPVVI
jgi:Asp-tRNA(Asn)/Glu-tRNA(Gln) amidotransferase B subunit